MDTQAPSASPFKILVVEDELLTALDLRHMLQDGGYHVIGPASSVELALKALEDDLPDACLLDVNLRGVFSAPVAQMLRERGVPFVLITAYPQNLLDEHDAYAGVSNIGKPVSARVLLGSLADLLRA